MSIEILCFIVSKNLTIDDDWEAENVQQLCTVISTYTREQFVQVN